MKILKLRYKNINSLKGEGEIDFIQFLNHSSLFAITGDTGSGKTTLLDIITCALYARTARLDGEVRELLRRGSGEALCEVEFEVNNKAYRSSWNLRRARGKADGKFQPTKMELYTLEGESIISGVTKVPKKIEEIIGLDFERFTKSMMLSQGAFDAFLRANSKERSGLLEKITGVTIYSEISKMVFEKAKAKGEELKLKEAEIKGVELLSKEERDKLIEELKAKEEEKKRLKLELDNLKYEKDFLKLERELNSKKEVLKEAERNKDENSHLFKQLDRAKRALDIYHIYNSKRDLANNLEKKIREIEELNRDIIELNKKKIELNRKREEAHSKLINFSSSYENLISKYPLIDKLINEIRETQDNIDINLNKLKDFKREKEEFFKENNLSKDEIEALELELNSIDNSIELAKEEESLRERKEFKDTLILNLDNYQNNLRILDEKNGILNTLENEREKLNRKKIELADLIDSKKEHLETLEVLREKELLIKKYEEDRKRLREGEPCFLCGSTSHPYIKEHIDMDNSTTSTKISNIEDEINSLEQELLKVEKELSSTKSTKEAIESEIYRLKDENRRLEEFFKEYELNIETQDKKVLERDIKDISLKLSNLSNLRKLYEISREIKKIEQEIDSYQKEIEDKKEELERYFLEFEIRDRGDYKEALKELESKKRIYKEAKDNLDNLEDEYKILLNTLENRNNLLEKYKKDLIDIKNSSIELDKEFSKELKRRDFIDENEFLASYLEDNKRRELEETLKSIEQSFMEAKASLEDIEKRLKEYKDIQLSNLSLDEIDKEIENLDRSYQELLESMGGINSTLKKDKKAQEVYSKRSKAIDELRQEFEIIDRLKSLIGSADGKKFTEFAQKITLNHLITIANRHLKLLSDRYLIAKKLEKGLEIVIIDKYQANEHRPSNTLSGGESFLISLSLALGLSELASRRVVIDSLFLDEGFGTLDSNTLDIALDALSKLESRGKMVGIISHVDSIKERIPLQIKLNRVGGGESKIELIRR